MTINLLEITACPTCNGPLRANRNISTTSGKLVDGALFCDRCEIQVATVKNGKFDFIRVEKFEGNRESSIRDNFYYERVPWSDKSVTYRNMQIADIGWNSEGYPGCLTNISDKEWQIRIISEATDLSLRFLTHDWSGGVSVAINDGAPFYIDLYSNEDSATKSFDIYENSSGLQEITLTPFVPNPLSKGSQVFFLGMDATYSDQARGAKHSSGNRGNGFPEAYNWVLANLGKEAKVLDCGAGDRAFPDERVISLEYLDFELPHVFGDGHALPFADEVFDAVFSQAVMEHMRDPYMAAKEIARVLKPGGLIYVESAFLQPLHAVP